MPAAKRQKKTRNSDVSHADSENPGVDSSNARKTDSGALAEVSGNDCANPACPNKPEYEPEKGHKSNAPEKKADPKPHEYICIHRPFFDVEQEGKHDDELELDEIFEKRYQPGFEAESKAGIFRGWPSEHKDHKWVIMWDAFLKNDILGRKAKYCDPDRFGMHIYSHYHGYGMMEIVENMMIEFDKGFRQKDESRLNTMWVVISALGLWLNTSENIIELINVDDADGISELIGLMGCAFLTMISAIDHAGELSPDSKYLDLPLVIGYFLEAGYGLPDYGIEGECMAWLRDAVALFKKGKLDPKKALFDTAARLKDINKSSNYDGDDFDSSKENETSGKKRKRGEKSKAAETDPWKWNAKLKEYKKMVGRSMGGEKYDITKKSRAERAREAFDGKDPLADVSLKDLKDDLLDFA